MSWICLNGTMSTTVQGLLIQTLPPISKPLMRTMIEEIDGRDGDIVTKLGYSAYDKELTIGLYGNYDIDEVISFFNSEGEVIFSNEPDKFYRYQILDQIDFEHLLRFKTATVVFHVQPFKYSAVDDAYKITTDVLNIHRYSCEPGEQYDLPITVSAEGNAVDVFCNETITTANSYKIPIDSITLDGSYTFTGSVTHAADIPTVMSEIRLITDNPVDAESFGGGKHDIGIFSTFSDTETVSDMTFNYLWVNLTTIMQDQHYEFHVWDESAPKYSDVINRGNIYAKPRLTIYGSGDITLSIDGVKIFDIALGSGKYITIDAETMNAYKGDALKNRLVSGDYNKLRFPVGKSRLSWTGTVREILVENGARWI